MTERRAAEAPIGVFDSGVGGLTVLAALTRELPAEDFVYLGDTARLPYGTRARPRQRRFLAAVSRPRTSRSSIWPRGPGFCDPARVVRESNPPT